ncbi:MAG TPA: SipW-dependent-type signal peptide-containing protein [Anaerolineales bacterium]|nr:SipW-dependent-type signal peptide-containing protein [Anaerolineales bacterium]
MTRRIAFLVLVTAALSSLVGATLASLSDSQVAQGEITVGVWSASEGCSHGFWKNDAEAWGPTGYAPDRTVGSVFVVPVDYGLDIDSLQAALEYGGGDDVAGGARILLRAAVAALLNAEHPGINYPRSSGDVIASVNTALASGNRDTMLALAGELEADNNLGCPL